MNILSSPGCSWILGGAGFFVAENALLSENREWIIKRTGEDMYHNIFGLLSTIANLSVFYGFFKHRNSGPIRFSSPIPMWRNVSALLLQFFGFNLILQLAPTFRSPFTREPLALAPNAPPSATPPQPSLRLRCPFDFAPATKASKCCTICTASPCPHSSAEKVTHHTATGVHRITRHPMLVGLASVGAAALVASPRPQVAALGIAPILVAVFGAAHQDSRHRRGIGGSLSPADEVTTSHVPFGAVLRGEQSLADVVAETKAPNAALAALVALLAWRMRAVRWAAGSARWGRISAV